MANRLSCPFPILNCPYLPFRKSLGIVHFWLNTIDFAAQPSGANVDTGTRWAIFVSFLAAFWEI